MQARLITCAAAFAVTMAAEEPRAHAAGVQAAPTSQEFLSAHNRWRREVGVADLRWAGDLADSAQRWAEHLRATRNCMPAHSANPTLGENLYWAGATRWSDGRTERQRVDPLRVVSDWAREKALYDERTGRCVPGSECGHYTQVVWRATSELGCGVATCPDLSQIWVCHYRPPGNFSGQRAF